ncbi:unnamed protein product [Ophioblennius macclurei]
MSNTVLEVGTGVFIIALVWIGTLLFGMFLLKASGSAKLGIIPVFLLALSVTLLLVFFPRSEEAPPPYKETRIVDQLFITRYVLLAVTGVIFLVAFVLLLPFHLMDPVYAKPLRM